MQELLERKKGLHRKILIVDDEFIEREMLGAMLSDLYEMDYAENGAVALEMIRREQNTLSLIILDLHMPEMDGYSLLSVIKNEPGLSRIPVIVLTSEKEAEAKSLRMGASDFITKPYDMPDVIRARVSRSIELAENSIIIHETERDELTGLFHKEFFFEYGKMVDKQNNYAPMDAIVLDVNRFHVINELYGRSYGDLVLRRLGNFIHDIVNGSGGLACRSDSNCFYMYIPHSDDIDGLLNKYTELLKESIEDSKVSIRIGACSDDRTELDMEQRFDRARLACRKLRRTYTTSFSIYDSVLHDKELHSERLISDMDRALEEKQFIVVYQPKYDIRGDKPILSSAEALVRWKHPDLDMIGPGEFISLFENNGLIQKLDRYVWSETAANIRSWKECFGHSVPVSVNVSRVDIFNPLLSEILTGIMRTAGLENGELLLEITESAYTDNSERIIDTVSSLRQMGFRIEMDDFGCGYSSLNMLTSLPIDALKLDMKFIHNICVSPKDLRLVEIMIEIARLLEVPVIAEGVETAEQMELLKNAGCDIIQGYYFSRPLPPEDFAKLMEKEKENA